MREQYYEQLDLIVSELSAVTATVRQAVTDATEALLQADTQIAESVIGSAPKVADVLDDLEERSLLLLATQQPVATDLRQLVATLRMLSDLDRLSALSVHVAKIARRRMPDPAVPLSVQPTIRAMASIAEDMISSTALIVANRDIEKASAIENDDSRMDDLRRELFRIILDERWEHGTEAAIDLALLGRYYERMGDHAVNMARRIVFLVTGQMPLSQGS
jgi:phosphate transport system protein